MFIENMFSGTTFEWKTKCKKQNFKFLEICKDSTNALSQKFVLLTYFSNVSAPLTEMCEEPKLIWSWFEFGKITTVLLNLNLVRPQQCCWFEFGKITTVLLNLDLVRSQQWCWKVLAISKVRWNAIFDIKIFRFFYFLESSYYLMS